MEFKYSISVLFSHLGYALRIFLWTLLSLVLTLCLAMAILLPVLELLSQTTDVVTYALSIKECFANVWNGTAGVRVSISEFINLFNGALHAIAQNVGATIALAFVCVILYAFYCFVFGLSYYTLADVINNIIASNMRSGFASTLALNFKKCVKYSGARLTITLPMDVFIVTVLSLIVFGLFRFIGFFMLPLAIVVGVVLLSLRATFLSGWLPRMIFHPEERVYTAFTRSLTYVKANQMGLFKSYAITFTIVYVFATSFSACTGGLINLVLPAIYYFLLRAIELIGYYKTKGLSFYTDATTVINTVDYGLRKEQQGDAFEYTTAYDAQISIDEYTNQNEED